MKQQTLYLIAAILLINSACQKTNSPEPKRSEVFFSSKQDAADRVNRFTGQRAQPITSDGISNISYIHTANQSFAFVFYETMDGSKNLVVTRTYTANGAIEKESATTCDGTCGCQVQAVIDNQGNVSVGCSCANCALVNH